MSNESILLDSRNILARIAGEDTHGTEETAVVASPGAGATAWAVKVKSHSPYAPFNVNGLVTGDAESVPAEIGKQMQTTNLTEPFDEAACSKCGNMQSCSERPAETFSILRGKDASAQFAELAVR